jgi:hypothetical protein
MGIAASCHDRYTPLSPSEGPPSMIRTWPVIERLDDDGTNTLSV